MADGLTFDDITEARDYINQQKSKGIKTRLIILPSNQFKVFSIGDEKPSVNIPPKSGINLGTPIINQYQQNEAAESISKAEIKAHKKELDERLKVLKEQEAQLRQQKRSGARTEYIGIAGTKGLPVQISRGAATRGAQVEESRVTQAQNILNILAAKYNKLPGHGSQPVNPNDFDVMKIMANQYDKTGTDTRAIEHAQQTIQTGGKMSSVESIATQGAVTAEQVATKAVTGTVKLVKAASNEFHPAPEAAKRIRQAPQRMAEQNIPSAPQGQKTVFGQHGQREYKIADTQGVPAIASGSVRGKTVGEGTPSIAANTTERAGDKLMMGYHQEQTQPPQLQPTQRGIKTHPMTRRDGVDFGADTSDKTVDADARTLDFTKMG
jgi:hypothetical protein